MTTEKIVPRLRFAPSPTGSLHVGGARTALFNYLYARATGGTFILRIEDTDIERSTAQSIYEVLLGLKWLGINWDEGVVLATDMEVALKHPPATLTQLPEKGPHQSYFQSKRLPLYHQHVEKLLATNWAYPCFCTDSELASKRHLSESMGKPYVYDQKCRNLSMIERENRLTAAMPHTIRFKTPQKEVIFNDLVKNNVKFTTQLLGDFVIMKSNGFPTYNFAVVIDDALMKITHVLRGDDHISNTPRQLLLYEALGYAPPQFAHVAMILGPSREKLSKRDGATSILEFKRAGYYPQPLNNHLALLGWSPQDGNEYLTQSQLEKAFKKLKFSSAPAIFDYQKLDYFNGRYLRELPPQKRHHDLKKFLENSATKHAYLAHPKIDALITAVEQHCHKLSDITHELEKILEPVAKLSLEDKELLQSPSTQALSTYACTYFAQATSAFITEAEFTAFKANVHTQLNLRGKRFFISLRLMLLQAHDGIELIKYFQLIPRANIIKKFTQFAQSKPSEPNKTPKK